jgi:hypothetical protein
MLSPPTDQEGTDMSGGTCCSSPVHGHREVILEQGSAVQIVQPAKGILNNIPNMRFRYSE